MIASPAGGVVRHENKIVGLFQAAGATSPDRARTPAALGVHEGLAFRVLCRHAILREAGEHHFYLEEQVWEAHRARRRRIALTILGTVFLVAVVVVVILLAIRR